MERIQHDLLLYWLSNAASSNWFLMRKTKDEQSYSLWHSHSVKTGNNLQAQQWTVAEPTVMTSIQLKHEQGPEVTVRNGACQPSPNPSWTLRIHREWTWSPRQSFLNSKKQISATPKSIWEIINTKVDFCVLMWKDGRNTLLSGGGYVTEWY